MNTVLKYRDGEAMPAIRSASTSPYLSRVRTGMVLLLSNVLIGLEANAEDLNAAALLTSFDQKMLSQRGIDPSLATLLLTAPSFTAGRHPITLTVNGLRRGRVDVTFNREGDLCFDRALLDAANLTVPSIPVNDKGCFDVLATWPQSRIEQDPANLGLSLIVPTQAIRPTVRDISGYQTGGIAGLLNYDVNSLHSQYGNQSNRYLSANTEVGFNAGDWIVRSRQVQTWQNDVSRTTHLAAYTQRTFASHETVLQAGQVNLYNPVLAGAQITGVQVMTEQALQVEGQSTPIEGIAQSQAQVEIRQNGSLIHSTVVPAGPFSLSNVRRLNSRSDVEVTVKEADGSEQRFTVPVAMLGVGLPAPGFSLAAGQVRSLGAAQSAEPWVISGGWSGALNPNVLLSTGATGAADYRAAGTGLSLLPGSGTQIQTTLQMADTSTRQADRGLQADLNISQRLGEQWSINAATSHRTFGYRELSEAVIDTRSERSQSRYRDQQSLSLAWSTPGLGAFSSGFSRSTTFDGQSSSRALASWGTNIRGVSISATAQRQVSGTQRSDDSVYLSLSIPLGENRRARTWVRSSAGDYRSGVGLNEQVNDQLGYRVGVEYDTRDKQVQSSAGVSLLPRYSQLDLNYTRSDAERSSYQVGARGGMVLHGDGLTLSPYPVRDTFALLSVGDASAIKVSTPSGPVWTDWQGRAVVPQLAAYGRSPIEVDTRSLPRNLDINNGLAVVSAGRGAVDKVEFGITLTRRALLKVTTDNGAPLPRGATVSTANGEFVTLAQEGGLVFLPNVLDNRELWITAPGLERCELRFELPAKANTQVYYETAAAQCRTL
ncbi:P pilus assembly protein, porin PapC [Pseudomonas sp. GM49]|uniref:fimbria/pilus outer membrane usher protein n=1 Tax=Pseudomonas sp. GM49 TaxID=1144331 RepID=UPI0002701F32|nr:fimbria/pilus outer membrane usher protein [Pseudomonas sp. GM49]EJM63646.1 P pilus assembly protein, porin PapC [Pseudomonas sp. GM49]